MHGASGASDSARRYLEQQAHTEAPLTVAWLNLGQSMHCPSVPHLNWPTGQAEKQKWSKSSWVLVPDMTTEEHGTKYSHAPRPRQPWVNLNLQTNLYLSGYLGARWLPDWQTGPCNEGYKLKTITVMNPIVMVNLWSKPACHWHTAYH